MTDQTTTEFWQYASPYRNYLFSRKTEMTAGKKIDSWLFTLFALPLFVATFSTAAANIFGGIFQPELNFFRAEEFKSQ